MSAVASVFKPKKPKKPKIEIPDPVNPDKELEKEEEAAEEARRQERERAKERKGRAATLISGLSGDDKLSKLGSRRTLIGN